MQGRCVDCKRQRSLLANSRCDKCNDKMLPLKVAARSINPQATVCASAYIKNNYVIATCAKAVNHDGPCIAHNGETFWPYAEMEGGMFERCQDASIDPDGEYLRCVLRHDHVSVHQFTDLFGRAEPEVVSKPTRGRKRTDAAREVFG